MASTSAQTEESRAFLQERLALVFHIGAGLSGIFFVLVIASRAVFGDLRSELLDPSRWMHAAAVVWCLLFLWFLRARPRSPEALDTVDAIGILGICLLLDLNAALFAIRTVGTFNMILVTGLVLILRSVAVPSTWRRALFLALVADFAAIAIHLMSWQWNAAARASAAKIDWPLPYQIISLVLWLGATTVTSVVASWVIWDLRQEIRSARRLGQYVLEDKLGEGGMGIVFRARHAMLRRPTAVKLLPPDRFGDKSLARFEREVVLTAKLRHPNTVAVYDYGRTPDGIFYYAMELLEGATLDKIVERTGPMPPSRVVHVLAQISASLAEAHEIGLVHRDVKPANVILTTFAGATDHVKVLDFGLVKDLTATRDDGASVEAAITGTPLYLSPEAIVDPAQVGPRSDLYAMAAVGYYLLTGTPVFERHGATVLAICAAHVREAPEPPSQRLGRPLPEDLEALLLRTLAKSPDQRPEDAHAFRDALLACAVPRWTEAEARAWWAEHGGELAKHTAMHTLESATTIVERAPSPSPSEEEAPQRAIAAGGRGSPSPRRRPSRSA